MTKNAKVVDVGQSRVSSGGRVALGALLLVGCANVRSRYGDVDVVQGSMHRALSRDASIDRSCEAVGLIETDVGEGMGFVIDPDGYLITARHVVEDADHVIAVTFPSARPPRRYEGIQIVYIDPERDLALLRINGDGPLPHAPLATGKTVPVTRYLRARDPIVTLRKSEDGGELERRNGSVNALAVYNPAAGPNAFVGVTTAVQRGQSGGPVLDRYGRVVGIVTWTWRDRDGGFAIPIGDVPRMLRERPRLDDDSSRASRAEDRSREFLSALGRGDVENARRLTSPSHARAVREAAMDGIMRGVEDGGLPVLQGFVAAVESLVPADGDVAGAFERLEDVVSRTGTQEFREALGVDESVAEPQVVSFFYELGQAYLIARSLGRQPESQAIRTAMLRLQSIDAARTFALAEMLEEIAGNEIEIERIEIVPGVYQPRAVVALRSRGVPPRRPERNHGVQTELEGTALTLHLRLEWGDWYVADIVPTPLADRG